MAKGKGNATTAEGSSENGEKSGESEFITLAVARELLLVQERMFKSFTDSLIQRVDDLVGKVADLKVSLEYSNKEIILWNAKWTKPVEIIFFESSIFSESRFFFFNGSSHLLLIQNTLKKIWQSMPRKNSRLE